MAKVKIDKSRCKGCYLCVTNCPNGFIKISPDINIKGVRGVYFSGAKCTGCRMCALVCPECIIEIYK